MEILRSLDTSRTACRRLLREGTLGLGAEGSIDREVAGREHLTPFTRRPWLVPLASLLMALFAIFRALR